MSRVRRPLRVPKRWRWQVAALANRLPWTCWSDLVDWALTDGRFDDERSLHASLAGGRYCRDTTPADGACYCAKVRGAAWEFDSACSGRAVRPTGKRAAP